ncbi:MAG: hypothetical protein WCE58_01045 [Gallionella sp.]
MTTDIDDIEIQDAHVSDYEWVASLVKDGLDDALMDAVNSQYGANTVRYLLEEGADPNIADDWGDYPLDIARYYKSQEVIALLEAHGAEEKGECRSTRYLMERSYIDGMAEAHRVLRNFGCDPYF